MANMHKLWEVTYDYRVNVFDENLPVKDSFVVVAGSQTEALKKADSCFAYSEPNRELLARSEAHSLGTIMYGLRRNACEYKGKMPKLALESDSKEFNVRPRAGIDEMNLEFVVLRK